MIGIVVTIAQFCLILLGRIALGAGLIEHVTMMAIAALALLALAVNAGRSAMDARR